MFFRETKQHKIVVLFEGQIEEATLFPNFTMGSCWWSHRLSKSLKACIAMVYFCANHIYFLNEMTRYIFLVIMDQVLDTSLLMLVE